MEDALEKMQMAIDTAVESVQPIEEDPEKKKQLEKQCVLHCASLCLQQSKLKALILQEKDCQRKSNTEQKEDSGKEATTARED